MNREIQFSSSRAKESPHWLFGTVVLMLLIVSSACSESGSSWTEAEKENIQYFFASGEMNRAAVAYSNRANMPFDESEYLDLQRSALADALKVKDAVLTKAHPDLPENFRSLYQRSLELSVEAFENNDNAASLKSSSLHDQWVDWYKAHRREIRIPR